MRLNRLHGSLQHSKKLFWIGICKSEFPNRLLLWVLFEIFSVLASIALILIHLEYAETQLWPRWGGYASGGLKAVSTVLLLVRLLSSRLLAALDRSLGTRR